MSVKTNPYNYANMNLIFSQFVPARNSPKEISGASGGFLPKPLLLRLRLPNSKTNQPKFWQILSSPKNSFAKTSSALFRHLPEYLEGKTPKKNVLSTFKKKFIPAKSKKPLSQILVPSRGIEPLSQDPQSCILSVEL